MKLNNWSARKFWCVFFIAPASLLVLWAITIGMLRTAPPFIRWVYVPSFFLAVVAMTLWETRPSREKSPP